MQLQKWWPLYSGENIIGFTTHCHKELRNFPCFWVWVVWSVVSMESGREIVAGDPLAIVWLRLRVGGVNGVNALVRREVSPARIT